MSASGSVLTKVAYEARDNSFSYSFFAPVRPDGWRNPEGVLPFSATNPVEASSLRGPGQQHLAKTDATRVVGRPQNRLCKGVAQ